jgi:hypothetical protein
LACPRRCDVARHLLLTVVTSPLRATTPSAPLGRAESLFARARVCTRAAHLLRAQTAANQHSAQHRPAPRDPTFHPPKTPTPPTANSAALSHLAHPHALHPAHPRSAHTTRTPRSPRASRTALPGPCAAHAATVVSHFRGSHTPKPHRPPPLPEVRHGRRPAEPTPITPLHPLSPAHPAEPAPHTHSGAHRAVGRHSASGAPPPRGTLAAGPFAPRVHQGPVVPDPARHSVPLHPGRPLQRLGCPPQRPGRSSRAAACLARHSQRGHAPPNRHLLSPPCGAPEGDLPEPRRWKVAAGVGRGARVATSRVAALHGVASANGPPDVSTQRILT